MMDSDLILWGPWERKNAPTYLFEDVGGRSIFYFKSLSMLWGRQLEETTMGQHWQGMLVESSGERKRRGGGDNRK